MTEYTRRDFIKCTSLAAAGLGLHSLAVPGAKAAVANVAMPAARNVVFEKDAVSLATWSLNKTYAAGLWKLRDIPRICREDFDIGGIEFVTHFFTDVREVYLTELNKAAADYGVKHVLIMVDREGDMVCKDKKTRMQAAINHRKWVEIAAFLGCHGIRCNATVAHGLPEGDVTPEQDPEALDRAVESFGALVEYAEEFKINILVENHGGKLSTNPQWLVALAKKLNHPQFGLLPDFAIFNVSNEGEIYEAIRMTMPYAKGASVKGGWSPEGQHQRYDLEKGLKIAKESGYTGYWGIESSIRRPSGYYDSLSPNDIKKDEWQAVRWTKAAIDKVVIKGAGGEKSPPAVS